MKRGIAIVVAALVALAAPASARAGQWEEKGSPAHPFIEVGAGAFFFQNEALRDRYEQQLEQREKRRKERLEEHISQYHPRTEVDHQIDHSDFADSLPAFEEALEKLSGIGDAV